MTPAPAAVTFFVLALTGLVAPPDASGQPFELSVTLDRTFGSTPGVLVIGDEGVRFRMSDPNAAQRWAFSDLKQIRVLSPTRLVLATYQDRGPLALGADRSFEFDVRQEAIGPELVAFLLARVERPVVTAVMPPLPALPLHIVPVKHQRRGRGSEGSLRVDNDGLAYVTARAGEARFWRFRDVESVLRLDRFRLLVVAYEGGSGQTRPFTFELKADLSAEAYDILWQRINAPALARSGGASGPTAVAAGDCCGPGSLCAAPLPMGPAVRRRPDGGVR